MTPAETLALTRFVRAACPQQKFDEYTPDAWAMILGDLDYADARTAAADLAKRQPFIAPAEIRTEVKRVRAARFTAEPGAEQPPAVDPDDVTGYLEALRRQRQAVADGREPLPALEPPKQDRPVRKLLASTESRQYALAAARVARQERAGDENTRRLVSQDRAARRKAVEAELDALRATQGATP